MCLFCPSFLKDLLPGFTDVVEDTCDNDESHEVLFVHLMMHTESPPVCFEVAKGALHCYVATAQAVVGVLLLVAQLLPIGLHQPEQEG